MPTSIRLLEGPQRTFALALLLLGAARCGDPEQQSPSVGTNSNWLRACTKDADCSGMRCRCGACTPACASNADCSALSEARCASGMDPAAASACVADTATAAAGLCLPRCMPGGCTEEQACVADACIPSAVPAGAFCESTATRSLAERTRADEMLALLEQIRSTGAGCAGAKVAPAVRLSASLVCAARLLADDIQVTRSTGTTDSKGRAAPDRIAGAGYTSVLWWESTAVGATSAQAALALMLQDPQACSNWTNTSFTDVGVGVAGDAVVVTLASAR